MGVSIFEHAIRRDGLIDDLQCLGGMLAHVVECRRMWKVNENHAALLQVGRHEPKQLEVCFFWNVLQYVGEDNKVKLPLVVEVGHVSQDKGSVLVFAQSPAARFDALLADIRSHESTLLQVPCDQGGDGAETTANFKDTVIFLQSSLDEVIEDRVMSKVQL